LDDFAIVKVAPLTDSEITNFLQGLPPALDPSRIENILRSNETLAQAAKNPLLLRLLVYALCLGEFDSGPPTDPAWVALALGNDLAQRGDIQEALRVFNAAAGGQTSLTTTLADVLSAQLLAGLGRDEDADLAFERAKSKYGLLLENLPNASRSGLQIDEDQQRILQNLRMGITYDVSQIASSALLPPGAVQRALSDLTQAGLIAPEEDPRGAKGSQGTRWRLTDAALSEKTMF
jgi:tetratricopeptide (TPR) repeat protein